MNTIHRWVICGMCLLGGSTLVLAQTPGTAAVENSATRPALSRMFEQKHKDNVAVARKGDIDLLFMGDSITDWWRSSGPPFGRAMTRPAGSATRPAATLNMATTRPAGNNPFAAALRVPGAYTGKPVFDKYFGQMKVANFGIAGDTTQGVLYRLQHGEGQGFSPKAIMLMIGTNNIGRNSAEQIAEGITADVRELQKDFPTAHLLLLGIFPRNFPATADDTIKQINSIISKLADGDRVVYMDLTDKFVGPDGKVPQDVFADGLHPTTKGYTIWAQAVIEPLKQMLAAH